MNIKLSNASYKRVLVRLKEHIQRGLELKAEDSDYPGDKYTHCTWGLCSEEKQTWPDSFDHLWPDQFLKDGRVAPKYRKTEHLCPMDTRELSVDGLSLLQGCFYTCRIFRSGKGQRPTREQTIKFFDHRIEQSRSLK